MTRPTAPAPAGTDVAGRGFRLERTHHTSHHVPDLDEAARWVSRVFRRETVPIADILNDLTLDPEWPLDYSFYTFIADVAFNPIDPTRFVFKGQQYFPTVTEGKLKDFGFAIGGDSAADGMKHAYKALRREGFHAANTIGQVGESDEEPPPGPNVPTPFFALSSEAGLRYQFFPAEPFPHDARSEPGWVLPPVSAADPLGIECSQCYTVLSHQPERPLRLMVDALGGEVIAQGRNELLDAASTWVHLANTTMEFAKPDEGSPAYAKCESALPNDVFSAITWKVVDLGRVADHLEAQGVRIAHRTDDLLVTDPTTSLGVPWGFTTSFLPGDPRARC